MKELEFNYGARAELFGRARKLRQRSTDTEKIIWNELRNRKLLGFKFRRQHPIYQFIADFYCHDAKLVVELDGEIHNTDEHKEYDDNRTAEMENLGLTVIRFTNEQVENDLDRVLTEIKRTISTTGSPSPDGEGDRG